MPRKPAPPPSQVYVGFCTRCDSLVDVGPGEPSDALCPNCPTRLRGGKPVGPRVAHTLYRIDGGLAQRLAQHVELVHEECDEPCDDGAGGEPCGRDDCTWCFEVALLAEARAAGLLSERKGKRHAT